MVSSSQVSSIFLLMIFSIWFSSQCSEVGFSISCTILTFQRKLRENYEDKDFQVDEFGYFHQKYIFFSKNLYQEHILQNLGQNYVTQLLPSGGTERISILSYYFCLKMYASNKILIISEGKWTEYRKPGVPAPLLLWQSTSAFSTFIYPH